MSTPPPQPPPGFEGDEDPTLTPGEYRARRTAQRREALQPGDTLGGYTIVNVLGEGAMGVVYRAQSQATSGEVALKILAPDVAGMAGAADRFRREAQAAARVAGHPGIAGVHDVGEADGLLFLVMELARGRPYSDMLSDGEPNPREAAAVVEQAARAVHHAHGKGVLHRDLKPSNLMVDRDGNVRVTDFGLAAVAGAAGGRLTQTGRVVGTPVFMPPEQARGERTDARSDVWALGATLFRGATGHAPVEGSSVEELLQIVVDGNVARPLDVAPELPVDMAAIIERCMQIDPAKRYPTALALAEDLDRFSTGRPVEARRGRLLRSLSRAAGRRPVAMALGLACFAGLISGGTWVVNRLGDGATAGVDVARRARTRAEVLQEAASAFYELRIATRRPLAALEDHAHGAGLDGDTLARHLTAIDATAVSVSAAHPGSTLPSAWRGLARCFAGQGAEGRALLHDAVADAGPDPFPGLLLARAELAQWCEAVDLPDLSYQDTVLRGELTETDAMADARAGATEALAALERSDAWAELQHGRELGSYAAALKALVDRRNDDARTLLLPLAEDDFVGSEARTLLGLAQFLTNRFEESAESWRRVATRGWRNPARWAATALTTAAVTGRLAGEDPIPLFARADAMYQAARAHWPHDPVVLRLHGQLLGMWAGHLHESGGEAQTRTTAALALLDEAVARSPDDAASLVSRALARGLQAKLGGPGAAQANRGAREDLDRVIVLQPDYASGRVNRANWFKAEAGRAESNGRPFRALCESAIADLDAALATAPRSRAGRITRAQVLQQLARAVKADGGDPEPARERAMQDYAELFRFYESAGARVARATLCLERGKEAQEAGGDGRAWLDNAIADCTAALQLNPRDANAGNGRGLAHLELGRARRASSEDPRPALDAAIADFTQSLAARPGWGPTLSNRALARIDRAEAERRRGGDGARWLRAAIEDCDVAIAQHPDSSAFANRGLARQRLADAVPAAGGDPLPVLEQALADYDAALERQPANHEARNGRALTHKSRGEALARRRADPLPDYRAAFDDFAQLIALDPNHVAARSNRATVGVALAEVLINAGKSPVTVLEEARADCTYVIERTPAYLNAYQNRGATWQVQARFETTQGRSPTPYLERALRDFQLALQQNDRYWSAWSASGWMLQQLGRADEAIAAYATSLKLAPNQPFIRTQHDALAGRRTRPEEPKKPK